jgi:hypothetical protein
MAIFTPCQLLLSQFMVELARQFHTIKCIRSLRERHSLDGQVPLLSFSLTKTTCSRAPLDPNMVLRRLNLCMEVFMLCLMRPAFVFEKNGLPLMQLGWRSYITASNAEELATFIHWPTTACLQEYFVPATRLTEFNEYEHCHFRVV